MDTLMRQPARESTALVPGGGGSAVRHAPRPCPQARRRPPAGGARMAVGGVGVSVARHPVPRPIAAAAVAAARGRARRWDVLVVAVVAAAIVLVGVVGFQLRSLGQSGTPTGETTVQVEPGDTLYGIAERAVPEQPTAVTVGRIRTLNELPDATVRAGQTLRVPTSAAH